MPESSPHRVGSALQRGAVWGRIGLLALMATALLLGSAPSASAASDQEAEFLTLINQERTSRGLVALEHQPVISDKLSRPWSRSLAATGVLAHSNVLSNALVYFPTITSTGENVGYAATVRELHSLLMASPAHRANILSPTFRHVGIGAVQQGSMVWVTETFFAMKAPSAPVTAAQPPPGPAAVVPTPRPPALQRSPAAPKPAAPAKSIAPSAAPAALVPVAAAAPVAPLVHAPVVVKPLPDAEMTTGIRPPVQASVGGLVGADQPLAPPPVLLSVAVLLVAFTIGLHVRLVR